MWAGPEPRGRGGRGGALGRAGGRGSWRSLVADPESAAEPGAPWPGLNPIGSHERGQGRAMRVSAHLGRSGAGLGTGVRRLAPLARDPGTAPVGPTVLGLEGEKGRGPAGPLDFGLSTRPRHVASLRVERTGEAPPLVPGSRGVGGTGVLAWSRGLALTWSRGVCWAEVKGGHAHFGLRCAEATPSVELAASAPGVCPPYWEVSAGREKCAEEEWLKSARP